MSSSQDVDCLLALLKVAEELLFSFPMPNEVISKYEFIRGKAFAKCALSYNGSHIRRLQLEAQAKLDKTSEKIVNTSSLEVKDLDLQNKFHQSSIVIQKLLDLLGKSVKISAQTIDNCELICNSEEFTRKTLRNLCDLPIVKQDIDENDFERVLEQYKFDISQSEYEIQGKLENIAGTIRSKNAYIRKLELEITEKRNEISSEKVELLETCENAKNKVFYMKSEYEKKLKDLREELLQAKSFFLNEARKAQLKEFEKLMKERDMYQEESAHLREQLESVSFTLQEEIRLLHEEYEKNIQEVSYGLSSQTRDVEFILKQKIESLEKNLFYREKELLEELSRTSQESNSKVQALEKDLKSCKDHEKVLQDCVDSIHSVVCKVYRRFSDTQENFGDLQTTLTRQIEFLDVVLNKLTSDNNWLVDRISELGKENENIKNSMKASAIKDTINDLNASTSVLKSFEASRERLKQKLSESSVQFPNTYSKLSHKYTS